MYSKSGYQTSAQSFRAIANQDVKYSPYKGGEKIIVKPPVIAPLKPNKKQEDKTSDQLELKWETKKYTNTADPAVWGPPLWFTIHNSASKYPMKAGPLPISRMKKFIASIPELLPCNVCKTHATYFINQPEEVLNDICSGREKLFKWFVDFHNSVNRRNNKPEMSLEEAYKLYSEGVNVKVLTYK